MYRCVVFVLIFTSPRSAGFKRIGLPNKIATDAHSNLLQTYGLLSDDVHLVANRPCFSCASVEGLVIDDFFCVSIDSKDVVRENSLSMLLYRRPMMNLLNEAFLLSEQYDDLDEGALIPLPRIVATKLTLCAVLAPLMMSDIAVEFEDMVYATDASEQRGAICSAFLGRDIVHMLYKVCRTKGAYTRLASADSFPDAATAEDLADTGKGLETRPKTVPRPLAFSFEFIEVFAGSSRISAALSRLGVIVGPPLDISFSEEFDLSKVHVLSWIYHLIESGRLLGIAIEPPCATFSIMRRPALRSRLFPLGFCPKESKTRLGNQLFLRALQILKKAALHTIAGLVERPFSALSKFLPSYEAALRWPGVEEVRVDSCQYGSIHRKSFALLVANMDLRSVARRCPGTCKHVPVAGVYTKASAIYTPELAAALAWSFNHAIQVIKARRSGNDFSPAVGLENQLVNEVMLTSDWEVMKSWKFKKESHINLLELKAVGRLIEDRAKAGPSRLSTWSIPMSLDALLARAAQLLVPSLGYFDGFHPLWSLLASTW